MDDDAFRVLDAIARGAASEIDDPKSWTEAFKTIRWVTQSNQGLILTASGKAAHQDVVKQRANAV